jgi:hypothetical protein
LGMLSAVHIAIPLPPNENTGKNVHHAMVYILSGV